MMINEAKLQKCQSKLELHAQVLLAELGDFVPEYKFHPTRRWRFDFCEVKKKIAVEIEGGVYVNGAHSRGKHFESDAEKYNEATLMGYRVFRFTAGMMERGDLTRVVGEASQIAEKTFEL